ncbi:phosphoadenosine phosphosulfate reductase [Rhodothermaceae bacterium RA]|nr:phosphoadenosine phosphosulfate reductase [Rhodothermaceae bacterium RA]
MPLPSDWTPDALQAASQNLRDASPRTILQWAFEQWAPDLVMATGFGPSGVVLMHQVAQLRPETTIFYLDTDLLFPETLALRDRLAERLGLTFTRIHSGLLLEEQAQTHGPELWRRDPNQCCFLRKVQPLRRFLADKPAWITGIRRDQATTRARAEVVEWDRAHQLVKINPLAHWTEDMVWGYIHLHDLPYNELHDRGYPSLGCLPCTRPVAPGEHPRNGRWAGHRKTECGIHLQPETT